MLRQNGARLVVSGANRQSVAAGRFFGLLYRWSGMGCLWASRRNSALGFHRRYLRDRLSNTYDSGMPKSTRKTSEPAEEGKELRENLWKTLPKRSGEDGVRFTALGGKTGTGFEGRETKEEKRERIAQKKRDKHQAMYTELKLKRAERNKAFKEQLKTLPTAQAATLQLKEKLKLERVQRDIAIGKAKRQKRQLAKIAKKARNSEKKKRAKEEKKVTLEREANTDRLEDSVRFLREEGLLPEEDDVDGIPFSMANGVEAKYSPSPAMVEQQQSFSKLSAPGAPFAGLHKYLHSKINGQNTSMSLTSEHSNTHSQETSLDVPDRNFTSTTSPPVDIEEIEAKESMEAKPELRKISENLRTIMRALPASVVVVTTSSTTSGRFAEEHPDVTNSDLTANARGITLSSFTTVTLDPHPIIQFNIKAPSRTLDALMETRHFLVHILEATKEGARIAAAFTKGNAPEHNPFQFPSDHKLKPTVVETRKWVTEKDGTHFRRTANFSKDDFLRNIPISFDPPTPNDKLKDEEDVHATEIALPRLVSGGVLNTLQCKVLDKGARGGGRGDGFVKVGDHVMVLARVHDIIGSVPVEHIVKRNKKALAYAHGSFTTTRSIITTEPSGDDFTWTRPIIDDETSGPPDTKARIPFGREMRVDGEGGEVMSVDFETKQHGRGDQAEAQTEFDKQILRRDSALSNECQELDDREARTDLEDQDLDWDSKFSDEAETEQDGHYWEQDTTVSDGAGATADTAEPLFFRKVRRKGATLRELNELAERYISKADVLRRKLSLPGELDVVTEPPAPVHVYHEVRGPRISKHFSTHGKSLPDIQTVANISKDFGIPLRIAEAAIKALPDSDEETRRKWAVVRAAEELDARRKEIDEQRETARAKLAAERLPSVERVKRRDFNKPVQIIKYGLKSPILGSEPNAKMAKVWKKIDRFKILESGLKNFDNEQHGLFWRPENIVKNEKIKRELVREEYYKEKGPSSDEVVLIRDPEEENLERFTVQDLEMIEERKKRRKRESGEDEIVIEPSVMVSEEEIEARRAKAKAIARQLERKERAEQRKREKTIKMKEEEKKRVYEEADPWADEFV